MFNHLSSITCTLVIIITLFNLDVVAHIGVRPGTTSSVFRKPVFAIPVEVLTSHFHSFDQLAQMGVELQHHEGRVSRWDNGIGGMPI